MSDSDGNQDPSVSIPDGAALSSAGERALQAKYGKTTHALAFYKHQVIDHLNDTMRAFISRMEMVFLATAGASGECRRGREDQKWHSTRVRDGARV